MGAPGLSEAKRLRRPGRCLFCTLVAPGKRFTCGQGECLRQYNRAWHRDMQRAHPERYGRDFYATRGGLPRLARAELPPRPSGKREVPASRFRPPSPFTPTTHLIEGGLTYAELCRRFDAKHGTEKRLWDG